MNNTIMQNKVANRSAQVAKDENQNIKTIFDLFVSWSQGKCFRKFNSNEIDNLAKSKNLQEKDLEQLKELFNSDKTCDILKKIVLTVLKNDEKIKIKLVFSLNYFLSIYKVFENEDLKTIIDNNSPVNFSIDNVITAINDNYRIFLGDSQIKKQEVFEKNVFIVILSLLCLKKYDQRIIYNFYDRFTAEFIRKNKLNVYKLEDIISTLDSSKKEYAIYKLVNMHIKKLDEENIEYTRKNLNLNQECSNLIKQVKDLTNKLNDVSIELERHKNTIHENKLLHDSENIENFNVLLEQKAAVRRLLSNEISSLETGLSALRKKEPKVHVMISYTERVVASLRSFLETMD